MSDEKQVWRNPKTPAFRVSYPNVFKPKAMAGGEPRYSVVAMIPKISEPKTAYEKQEVALLNGLRLLLQETVNEAYPNTYVDGKLSEKHKLPSKFRKGKDVIKDGDELDDPQYKGHWVINLKNKSKPDVRDKNLEPFKDEDDFYPGCWARAGVQAFCYDNMNVGVAFSLQTIRKLRDDEPFTSRVRADDDFDGDDIIEEGGSDFGARPTGDMLD